MIKLEILPALGNVKLKWLNNSCWHHILLQVSSRGEKLPLDIFLIIVRWFSIHFVGLLLLLRVLWLLLNEAI